MDDESISAILQKAAELIWEKHRFKIETVRFKWFDASTGLGKEYIYAGAEIEASLS